MRHPRCGDVRLVLRSPEARFVTLKEVDRTASANDPCPSTLVYTAATVPRLDDIIGRAADNSPTNPWTLRAQDPVAGNTGSLENVKLILIVGSQRINAGNEAFRGELQRTFTEGDSGGQDQVIFLARGDNTNTITALYEEQPDITRTYGTFSFRSTNPGGMASFATWTYTLDNSRPATRALNGGRIVTEIFPIRALNPAYSDRVTITVVGVDSPTEFGNLRGAVTEDSGVSGTGTLRASGDLAVDDPDANGVDQIRVLTGVSGTYGTLNAASGGTWNYEVSNDLAAVQELGEGETLEDAFTITAVDGTTAQLVITINGVNDAATFGDLDRTLDLRVNPEPGEISSDTEPNEIRIITGRVTVMDLDGMNAVVPMMANGVFGAFSIVADGSWTLEFNAADARTLDQDREFVDRFTITAADDGATPATAEVALTYIGANDPPMAFIDTPSGAGATTVNAGDAVNLSGRGIDEDRDDISTTFSYLWSAQGEQGVLTNADRISATWIAPRVTTETDIVLTLSVTDANNGTGRATVTITVAAPFGPSFVTGEIRNQRYFTNDRIDPLTLPAAIGTAPLRYSITPELPAPATFNSATRVVSGRGPVPPGGTRFEEITHTYEVRDAMGRTDSIEFDIIFESGPPFFDFDADDVPDQTFTAGVPITPLTLTEAFGGAAISSFTYTFTRRTGAPALPPGLSFNSATRVLSGTPTRPQPVAQYRYDATDESGETTIRFINIAINTADGTPVAALIFDEARISGQIYGSNTPFGPLTLPAATGGTGALTYSLTPELPAPARFDPGTRVLSGRGPMTGVSAQFIPHTYTVTDEAGITESITFGIAFAHQLPHFGFFARIPDMTYTVGFPITPVTLPEAFGGIGTLVYTFTQRTGTPLVPPGLSFDAEARALSGTPMTAQPATPYRYRAADSDSGFRTETLNTNITINDPGPADEPVAVGGAIAGTVVEAGEAGAGIPVANGAVFLVDDIGRTVSDATFTVQQDTDGDFGAFALDADGAWTYTLDNVRANGLPETSASDGVVDSFSVSGVGAGAGEDAITGTVTITIEGANDAPTATISAPADGTQVVFGGRVVLDGDGADPDTGETDTLFYQWRTMPANQGSFDNALNPDAIWTADAAATDDTVTLILTVSDNRLASDSAMVGVTVTAAPITIGGLNAGRVSEDGAPQDTTIGGTLTITNPNPGRDTSFTPRTDLDGIYGRFTINTAGVWSYTLDNANAVTDALAVDAMRTETFTVAASADPGVTRVITITVVGANDAPRAAINAPLPNARVEAGATLRLDGSGADVDTGETATLRYRWSTNPEGQGDIDNADNPAATWTAPAVTRDTAVTLNLRVTDGTASDTATVAVTVTDQDTAPVFGVASLDNQRYTIAQRIPDLTLPAATGGDGTLTYTIRPELSGGLSFNGASRVLSGTPTATQATAYTYVATDTDADAATLGFIITVAAAANRPATFGGDLMNNDQLAEDHGGAISGRDVANGMLVIMDADGPEQEMAVPQTAATGNPANGLYGIFTIEANGAWRFVLDNERLATQALRANGSGVDEFIVTTVDGTTQVITITVLGIGDPTVVTITAPPDGATVRSGETIAVTSSVFDPETRVGRLSYAWRASQDTGSFGDVGAPATTWTAPTLIGGAEDRAIQLSLSVRDLDDLSFEAIATSVMITVLRDTAPDFGTAAIDDQQYTAGRPITALLLPTATGGDGVLTYHITPDVPAGLIFDDLRLRLSGTPDAAQVSTSYEYSVTDDDANRADSDAATLSFTITIVRQALIGGVRDGAVVENDPARDEAAGMLEIVNPGAGAVTFVPQALTRTRYGTFTLAAGGGWTYLLDNERPATQALGAGRVEMDEIAVVASAADIPESVVTITVTGANDAPIAVADAINTDEDTPMSVDVLANDRDADAAVGESLSIVSLNGVAAVMDEAVAVSGGGTLTFTGGGTLRFDPGGAFDDLRAGRIRVVTAVYEVADAPSASGVNPSVTEGTVTMTVTGLNDAPVAVINTPADGAEVVAGRRTSLIGSGSDPDSGQTATLNYQWSTTPANRGSFDDAAGASTTWTAPASVGEVIMLSLTVRDSAASHVATVSVTVVAAVPVTISGMNTGTVAEAGDGGIDITGTTEIGMVVPVPGVPGVGEATGQLTVGGSTDGDNTFVTQTGIAGRYGAFTIAANGAWSYALDDADPDTNALMTDAVEMEMFTVAASAEPGVTETITITVNGVNDAPVAAAGPDRTVRVGDTVVLDGRSSTDPEGDALTYHWINATRTDQSVVPPSINIINSRTATAVFVVPELPARAVRRITARLVVTDEQGVRSADMVTITLEDHVQPGGITVIDDVLTTTEDSGRMLSLTANDSHRQNLPLTIVALNDVGVEAGDTLVLPRGGTLELLDGGSVRFDPNPDGRVIGDFDFLQVGDQHHTAVPYRVRDSLGATALGTLVILVEGRNDPPVYHLHPADIRVNIRQNEPTLVSVLDYFTDPEGEPLTVSRVVLLEPEAGIIEVTEDQMIRYTANSILPIFFRLSTSVQRLVLYTVSDPQGLDNQETINFAVYEDTPPDTGSPIGFGTFFAVSGVPTIIDIATVDFGEGFGRAANVANPTVRGNNQGTFVRIDNTRFTYTSPPGFIGSVLFNAMVTNTAGGVFRPRFNIIVTLPVNNPPVAVDDMATVREDNETPIFVLANDTDPDNDALVVTDAVVPNGDGRVTVTLGTVVVYTPAENFDGEDVIEYGISDSRGGTARAKVMVTLTPVNDAAIIGGMLSGEVTEDAAENVVRGVVTVDDVDNENGVVPASNLALTPRGDYEGIYGRFEIRLEGDWTYTLDNSDPDTDGLRADVRVTDTFDITALDGTPETITITVTGVNDAPTAEAGPPQTVAEGVTVTLDGTGSTDAEGGALTYQWTPAITLNDAAVAQPTFTAPTGLAANAVLEFQLVVTDDESVPSPPDTVVITVTGVDDAPVFDPASYAFDLEENLDGSTTAVALGTISATDPDDGDTPGYAITAGDPQNKFEINPVNGALSYIGGGEDFEAQGGPPVYNLTITATAGGTSVTAAVTVTVTNVNEPPVFDPATYAFAIAENRDGSTTAVALGTVTATDPDDPVTYAITAGDTNRFRIDEASGAMSYTGGGEDFEAQGGPPVYNLTITATAGGVSVSAAVTVTVTEMNELPVAVDDNVETNEDTAVAINVLANDTDADNDPLSVVAIDGTTVTSGQVVAVTNGGTLSRNADGNLTFNPNGEFEDLATDASREVTATYRITDGRGGTDEGGVTIRVIGVNDAPVAEAGLPQIVAEGVTVTLDGTGSTDAESGALTYQWELTGSSGITLNDAGAVQPTFTTPSGLSAPVMLEFRLIVTDDQGEPSPPDTVTITVTGVDDIPVFVVATYAFDLAENEDGRTTPVPVGTVIATDPDVSDTPRYAITDGNPQNRFEIAAASGAITYIGGGEDFEEAGGPPVYVISVTATSGGVPVTTTVTVTVTDVNEPPVFDPAAYEFAIAENRDGGTTAIALGTVTAADPEGNAVAYSITNGDTTRFGIIPATGAMSYTGAGEDFEAQGGAPVYDLTVTATAGTFAATAPVTVTVTDANDPPVAVDDAADTNEETAVVFDARTNDTDEDNDTLTVAAINGTSVINGQAVAVTGGGTLTRDADGRLRFNPNGAFENLAMGASRSVTATYQISDGQGGTDEGGITIRVAGVNDAPTAKAGLPQTVAEGVTVTLDGTGSSDPEGGALGYQWSRTGGPAVTLINPTAAQPTFTAPTGLSALAMLEFRLIVTDDQTTASTPDTVIITVTGVDDIPVFAGAPYAFDLAENLDGSTTPVALGTATATDPDNSDTPRYAITAGNPQGKFQIGSTSGAITYIGGGENFEEAGGPPVYELSVTATAGGVPVTTTVTVTVTNVDEPPVFVGDPYAFILAENRDGSMTPIDVNTVRATDPENDVITYAITTGGAGLFNIIPTTDVIRYIGTGEDFETEPLTYDLTVTATAGTFAATAPVTVTVTDANDPPVAVDDAADTNEETAVVFDARTNDTDEDNDTLTVAAINGTSVINGQAVAVTGGGTLTRDADGRLSFNPNGAFEDLATDASRSVTATYRITDGRGGTDEGGVTIRVAGVNDAPTAEAGQPQTVTEGVAVTLDGTGSTDPEGGALTYQWELIGGSGITLNDATATQPTFTAPTGLSALAMLEFRLIVTDDQPTASTPDTVIITVTGQDDIPMFIGSAYAFDLAENEDGRTTPVPVGTVIATDPDVSDTPRYAITAGNPQNRFAIDAASGTITYTGSGEDFEEAGGPPVYDLIITATSGGVPVTTTATVTVTNVNEAPEFDSATYAFELAENLNGSTAAVAVGTVTAADPEDDTIAYGITAGDTARFRIGGTSGAITYIGAGEDFEAQGGPPAYDLTITATAGAFAATAPVTVTVTDANDAPIAEAGPPQAVTEGVTVTLDGRASTDPEGGALTWQWTRTSGLAVTLNDATVAQPTFTAPTGLSAPAMLEFRLIVTDDQNTASQPDTVVITIAGQDDIPVFAGAPYAFELAENRDGRTTPVALGTATATDPDDSDTPVYAITAGDPQGRFDIDAASGAITYIGGGEDFEEAGGPPVYVLSVTATAGSVPVTTTATVTVTNVDEAPVAVDDALTVAEGGTGTILSSGASSVRDNDRDAETATGSLTVRVGAAPARGTLRLNADGTFTYTHDGSETTGDSFTYLVNDGALDSNTATVTITVTADNDAPTAEAGQPQTVAEGATVTLDGSASSDPESEALTFAWTRLSEAQVTLDNTAAERPTFIAPTELLSDVVLVFRLIVADPQGAASTPDTVTITVTAGANDAPTAHAGPDQTVAEPDGAVVTVTLDGSASTDPEGETLLYQWSQASGPGVTLAGMTTVRPVFAVPQLTESMDLVFSLTVRDGQNTSAPATVTITVTADNDSPVAVDDRITMTKGGTATLLVGGAASVLDNDRDPDTARSDLTASMMMPPQYGTLSLLGDGTFTYVHDGSEADSDRFTYLVNDGTSDSNIATVTVAMQAGRERHARVMKGWLARFGRTVASDAGESISERMTGPSARAGASWVVIGGHRMSLDAARIIGGGGGGGGAQPHGGVGYADANAHVNANANGPGPGLAQIPFTRNPDEWSRRQDADSEVMSSRELLTRSAFQINLHEDGANGNAGGGNVVLWGRGTGSSFDGKDIDDDNEADVLTLSGDVTSVTFGVESIDENVRGGIALTHSEGDGEWDFGETNDSEGDLEASLTSVYPYAHWASPNGWEVWGLLGYGQGEMRLKEAGEAVRETDIKMGMMNLGARYDLFAGRTFGLAVKGDALALQIESEETAQLAEIKEDVQRGRLSLEGTHAPILESGNRVRTTLELGVRQDAGDAETGTGGDVGVSFNYANPNAGVDFTIQGRYLVDHEDKNFEDWSGGVAARFDPGAPGRGLALTLEPEWTDAGHSQRLTLDFAGIWKGRGWHTPPGLRLELYGTRREREDAAAEHGIGLTFSFRF